MTEPIRLKKDGGIVEVLLSRPEAFNAFDLDMIGWNVLRPAKAGYEFGKKLKGSEKNQRGQTATFTTILEMAPGSKLYPCVKIGIESLSLTLSIFDESLLLTPRLFSLKAKKFLQRHPVDS